MKSLTDHPAVSPSARLTLYFAPLACSLASRIACYEAGADIGYFRVDTKTRTIDEPGDFLAVNPLGQVPVLAIGDDVLLTENGAVLCYLVDHFPDADLGPRDGFGRARLHQWLGFVSSELHKAVFTPLLDANAHPAVREAATKLIPARFGVLERHLTRQDHLLDRFSVVDAYLTVVLGWVRHCGIDLVPWPAVKAYHARIAARPQVARAMAEEFALWKAAR